MTEPAQAPESEALPDWELAADEAIDACGGDPRQTVIALLIANDFMEQELADTRSAVSFGYSRGWHRNRGGKGS